MRDDYFRCCTDDPKEAGCVLGDGAYVGASMSQGGYYERG